MVVTIVVVPETPRTADINRRKQSRGDAKVLQGDKQSSSKLLCTFPVIQLMETIVHRTVPVARWAA
jgi:hypothetical protein